MSIRCAVCGSKRVVTETKKEGYNTKKGILGTIFLGNIGAIAGASGNDVIYYHCADCGQVMNKCMSEFESATIDKYIENPNLWNKLLEEKKKQYPNIEWESKVEKLSEEKNIEEKADIIWNYYNNTKISYIESKELCKKIFGTDTIIDFYNAMELLEKRGLVNCDFDVNTEKTYYSFCSTTEQIKNNIDRIDVIDEADKILNTRNKEITNLALEMLEKVKVIKEFEFTNKLENELLKRNYSDNVKVINWIVISIILNLTEQGLIGQEGKNLLYLNEYEREKVKQEIKEKKIIEEREDELRKQKQVDEYKSVVLDVLKDGQEMTAMDIICKCEQLKNARIQQISCCLEELCNQGILKKDVNKKKKFYSIVR